MILLYHTEDAAYRRNELAFEIVEKFKICHFKIVLSTGILAKLRVLETIDEPFSWGQV
ncbi:hypothetical protein DOT_0654 [Desulfosporosinus sp. OT]|nr:hypothetical protein DOT_0654 [Desulfosporosinus sp. OT]